MKKNSLCFILFIISGLYLNAQNFQNICTPGITFYKNSSGNIKAFRLDSFYLPGNNDTVFISYRTIRPYFINGCYDTTNGSILGRKIYKNHNGIFYFFNYNHDTITIKSQEVLNQVWKFCNLPSNSYIEAKIISFIQDSILGFPDSVKVISLQAKNNSGQNISHFLNQKTLKISKDFGIYASFDLYYIPDLEYNDTSVYLLSGKTIPPLGIQNLTWKDIYDFDIGDEFHYSGHHTSSNIGFYWNIIKKVVSKTVYGSDDSVSYTMEYCKLKWFYGPPPGPDTTFIHDTITESYNFIQLAGDTTIQQLPEIFFRVPWDPSPDGYAGGYEREMIYNNRLTQGFWYPYTYQFFSFDSCWQYGFENTPIQYNFSSGLGQTYFYFYSQENPYQPEEWTEYLIYYKKGTETYGTPVASGCLALSVENRVTQNAVPYVKIFPNPFSDAATVEITGPFNNESCLFSVYDITGRQVYRKQFSGQSRSFSIERNNLPAGLYFFSVTTIDGKRLGQGKFLIK